MAANNINSPFLPLPGAFRSSPAPASWTGDESMTGGAVGAPRHAGTSVGGASRGHTPVAPTSPGGPSQYTTPWTHPPQAGGAGFTPPPPYDIPSPFGRQSAAGTPQVSVGGSESGGGSRESTPTPTQNPNGGYSSRGGSPGFQGLSIQDLISTLDPHVWVHFREWALQQEPVAAPQPRQFEALVSSFINLIASPRPNAGAYVSSGAPSRHSSPGSLRPPPQARGNPTHAPFMPSDLAGLARRPYIDSNIHTRFILPPPPPPDARPADIGDVQKMEVVIELENDHPRDGTLDSENRKPQGSYLGKVRQNHTVEMLIKAFPCGVSTSYFVERSCEPGVLSYPCPLDRAGNGPVTRQGLTETLSTMRGRLLLTSHTRNGYRGTPEWDLEIQLLAAELHFSGVKEAPPDHLQPRERAQWLGGDEWVQFLVLCARLPHFDLRVRRCLGRYEPTYDVALQQWSVRLFDQRKRFFWFSLDTYLVCFFEVRRQVYAEEWTAFIQGRGLSLEEAQEEALLLPSFHPYSRRDHLQGLLPDRASLRAVALQRVERAEHWFATLPRSNPGSPSPAPTGSPAP